MGWVEMQLARRGLEVKGKPIHLNTFGTKIVVHFSLLECTLQCRWYYGHIASCNLQLVQACRLKADSG